MIGLGLRIKVMVVAVPILVAVALASWPVIWTVLSYWWVIAIPLAALFIFGPEIERLIHLKGRTGVMERIR